MPTAFPLPIVLVRILFLSAQITLSQFLFVFGLDWTYTVHTANLRRGAPEGRKATSLSDFNHLATEASYSVSLERASVMPTDKINELADTFSNASSGKALDVNTGGKSNVPIFHRPITEVPQPKPNRVSQRSGTTLCDDDEDSFVDDDFEGRPEMSGNLVRKPVREFVRNHQIARVREQYEYDVPLEYDSKYHTGF